MKNIGMNALIKTKRERKLKYLFLSIKFSMTALMGIEIIISSSLLVLLHNKRLLNYVGDYIQAVMGITVTVGFLMLIFAYYMDKKLSLLSSYNNKRNTKKYNEIFPRNNNKSRVNNSNIIKSIFIKLNNIIGNAFFASMITFVTILLDVVPAFGILSSNNLHSCFEKISGMMHEPNITAKLSNYTVLLFCLTSISILLAIRNACISYIEYKNTEKGINNNDTATTTEVIGYNNDERKELRRDFLSNQRFIVISNGISICFCCMMTGLLLIKGLVDKNIIVMDNIPLPVFLSIVRGVVFILFGLTVITRNIIICDRENNLDQRFNVICDRENNLDQRFNVIGNADASIATEQHQTDLIGVH